MVISTNQNIIGADLSAAESKVQVSQCSKSASVAGGSIVNHILSRKSSGCSPALVVLVLVRIGDQVHL